MSKKRKWYSPKEVGEMIGFSDQCVRNMIQLGVIRAHVSKATNSQGREYHRIPEEAVEQYLMETSTMPDEEIRLRLEKVISGMSSFSLFALRKIIDDKLKEAK